MKRFFYSLAIAVCCSYSAHADAKITPVNSNIFQLIKDGWKVVGEAGLGVFTLSNGEEIALCYFDFKSGNRKFLRGEEVDEKFKIIETGCGIVSD